MELSKLKRKLVDVLQKYKFILLILCVGLILILLPANSEKAAEIPLIEDVNEPEHISQEALASILSRISGAGRVEVLLALEHSAQTDYQVNKDGATTDERLTTVTVTDSQRNEIGLIKRTGAPTYRGAIIVCDGADDPIVHLSVVQAVSNITGLRSDQISVLKMK